MNKDLRIVELMNTHDVDADVTEQLFYDEVCEKFETDDTDLAEFLFCVND